MGPLLFKKVVLALEEHYGFVSDGYEMDVETIPGYFIVAYTLSGRVMDLDHEPGDVILQIFTEKELIDWYEERISDA